MSDSPPPVPSEDQPPTFFRWRIAGRVVEARTDFYGLGLLVDRDGQTVGRVVHAERLASHVAEGDRP